MSESDCENEPRTPTEHWGEIPTDSTNSPPMLPNILEDIKKSMANDCLDKYPDDESIMQITDINLPPMDPLIMYAIQLHKWMSNMTETIRLAEVATESNLIPPEDAKVPIPEMPDIQLKHRQNNLNFIPAKLPLESTQNELEVEELNNFLVKKILTTCVAVMTAHIGFEESYQSVLDILVDVLEQFFVKICDRFVSAVNEEESLDTGGFPNVLERVLVEMGMGGAKGLHDYYQGRVIKYISVLQKRCKELEQYYSSLIVPKTESPTGEIGKWFRVRVKKEEDSMETDSDMTYGEGDLITSDYQLLSNLEPAVETLQDAPEGNTQIVFTS